VLTHAPRQTQARQIFDVGANNRNRDRYRDRLNMAIGHEKLDVYGVNERKIDPDSDSDLDDKKPQQPAGGD